MVDKLAEFYRDKDMVQAVHLNITAFIKEEAGTKAMLGKDVSGVKDANEMTNKFFMALKARYEPKKEKKVQNPE